MIIVMSTVPDTRPWFRFWPEGVPRSLEYPRVPLYDLLGRAAERFPQKTFLKSEGRAYSFAQVDGLSSRLGAALTGLGLRKGERVMLFMPNTPEFAICFYGVLKAGGTVTAANPMFKESELQYQMRDAGARTIIIDEELLETAQPVLSGLAPERVIVAGDCAHDYGRLGDMVNSAEPAALPPIDPVSDTAVLQYTGGTTGMPRGAMMTHFNLVANAIQNATWFKWHPGDVIMGTLPFYHTWGSCVCLNSPLYAGCSVTLMRRFDPVQALSVVQRERVSIWYGAATMFNILLHEPALSRFDLSSLRYVKAGAMPVPEEVRLQWNEATGVPLVLGYGLSEASPETHDSPLGRVKPGSVGIPLIDTDAMIVETLTGQHKLPAGEPGELVIRGPQVMKGYWSPDGQDEGGLVDGWLYTGDIAEMDSEGYFYIRDRKKDLIKYKGYSIAPAEVENLLFTHPAVRECAVVGMPDPVLGEVPKAFVVCEPGITVTGKELIDFCSERIAAYKRIREVEFIDEIPKNAVGKVLRRILRERGKSGAE